MADRSRDVDRVRQHVRNILKQLSTVRDKRPDSVGPRSVAVEVDRKEDVPGCIGNVKRPT